ncbi:hypothetical protein H9Q74_012373 [Fusarium xylarioides]|nr:hypothetical protein H9Q71_012703 [Fusarium xylarioides]KAG5814160.1 hypothetical protein H9Q74_012373 [Fusarium xylarioides]
MHHATIHYQYLLALGFAAEEYLPELARASVEAGVKRLIASGYGVDTIHVDFFGIKSEVKTAEVLDDGNAKFIVTTRDGVGQAVVGISNHLEETANRIVCISSTVLSLNDILEAEQSSSKIVATATKMMPRMMATGGLGLAVNVQDIFEANF